MASKNCLNLAAFTEAVRSFGSQSLTCGPCTPENKGFSSVRQHILEENGPAPRLSKPSRTPAAAFCVNTVRRFTSLAFHKHLRKNKERGSSVFRACNLNLNLPVPLPLLSWKSSIESQTTQNVNTSGSTGGPRDLYCPGTLPGFTPSVPHVKHQPKNMTSV